MSTGRFLAIAVRVIVAGIVGFFVGRRDPHPWDAAKLRRTVRNVVKARES